MIMLLPATRHSPRARRRLGTNSSPYRSPRSPATKRFQPASNTDTGDSVQVVKDRRVELRAVTVGVTNRGFAEARTGLAAGEIVIARAAAFLRNGDEVRFGVRVSTPWISAGAEWPWSAGLHSQPRSSLCVRNCRACPQQALGAEWLF